jgi:hypothetical protein
MKRICLLLTFLAVTVGVTSMAYATDNVMYRMLIPGAGNTSLLLADSTYAKVNGWNSGTTSINLEDDIRRFKAKMLRFIFYVADTSASSDSTCIVIKMSWDDSTTYRVLDTLEVIGKTPGSKTGLWVTVMSDSTSTYCRAYAKQWGLASTAVTAAYVAEIHYYDANGVWSGKRSWKTAVAQKGGY